MAEGRYCEGTVGGTVEGVDCKEVLWGLGQCQGNMHCPIFE